VGRRANAGGFGLSQSRGDRGAVLIEAAIITPMFVMLLFGIWTTARAWNVHNVLDHAARESARYGATGGTHTEILTVAEGEIIAASFPWGPVEYCVTDIDGASTNVTRELGWTGSPAGPGPCLDSGTAPGNDPTSDDRVQVFLRIPNYQLNFVFFSTTVNLEARAVARLEP
jgi:TadE-like protein